MRDDSRLIERLDPHAHVVHVAAMPGTTGLAGLAGLAVDGDEVDQRGAGAQLDQAQVRAFALDVAAENVAIKARHPGSIPHAQHDVVDPEDLKHASELPIS